MDKRQVRRERSLRFAELLRVYRERNGLQITQLASLLDRPRSTVRHWLAGTRLPHGAALTDLCARLNVSYEHMFSDTCVADVFYEDRVLGFAALQRRYLDAKAQDVLRALAYLPVAGALAFNHLVSGGFSTQLSVGYDYQVSILMDAPLRGWSVMVTARDYDGIGCTLLVNGHPKIEWKPLSELNLDSIIDIFQAHLN